MLRHKGDGEIGSMTWHQVVCKDVTGSKGRIFQIFGVFFYLLVVVLARIELLWCQYYLDC